MVVFGCMVLVVGIWVLISSTRKGISGVSGGGSMEYFESILRNDGAPPLGLIAAGLAIIGDAVHSSALVAVAGVLGVCALGLMLLAWLFSKRSEKMARLPLTA